MKDILMVLPFVHSADVVELTRQNYQDTNADVVGISEGKHPLITYADIEMNIPGMLNRIAEGEREGYRAVIVGCFGDPCLIGARELTSIPVIGPGETALAVASTLGSRIFVAEPDKDSAYATEHMVQAYGYRDKVIGVWSLDIVGGEDYVDHSDNAAQNVSKICLEAVQSLDIHVMIMGCIGFGLMIEQVRSHFKENGISIPIIEPGITAIEYGNMLLRTGYNQSRRMFSKHT